MEKYDYQERVGIEEIDRMNKLVLKHEEIFKILNNMPIWAIILNKTRQAVFINDKLSDDLEVADKHKLLGLRPGEIFSCQHAWLEEGGCGTSDFCKYCGVLSQ